MKKNPYPGRFIVFEGLDGSGISTQASLLVDSINKKTRELKLGKSCAHLTKEPTKSLIGGLINAQLSHHWHSSNGCLQLLFSADRSFHLEKEIIPLLQKGITVVCDRYCFSTLAFGKLEIDDFDWLLGLQKRFLFPDISFFLKVSPEICIRRIKEARFGTTLFEKKEKMEKAWQNFEEISQRFENIYIIDGERSAQEISRDIRKIVNKKLNLIL